MAREIANLERRRTWSLVSYSDVTANSPVDPRNWIYVEKQRPEDPNADAHGILRKSHWVVWVNRLHKSPRSKTYAPVVSITTTRLLYALAAYHDWYIRPDAVLAFLHDNLLRQIYMRQPTSFVQGTKKSLVCFVEESLYGLDPSAKIWFDTVIAIISQ